MNITLFITDNCLSCQRVKNQLKELLRNRKEINFLVEDIKQVNSNGVIIVPALFIDDELYSYGDLDEDKFIERLELTRAAN
ncbi:MAG: thioredoxin family protein [Bacteroidetes bacterium]|nr:thioredoxin family protein [Bacteroidota bacterium]